jgi:hypothetical protein
MIFPLPARGERVRMRGAYGRMAGSKLDIRARGAPHLPTFGGPLPLPACGERVSAETSSEKGSPPHPPLGWGRKVSEGGQAGQWG